MDSNHWIQIRSEPKMDSISISILQNSFRIKKMPPKCMLTVVVDVSLSMKSHKLLFFIEIPWSWRMKADVRKHILSTINPWMVWIGVSMSFRVSTLIKRDWMLALDSANEILTMSPVLNNWNRKKREQINHDKVSFINWQIGCSKYC